MKRRGSAPPRSPQRQSRPARLGLRALRRSPDPLTRIGVLVTWTVSACQSTSDHTTASASPMRAPVASMKNTKYGRSRRLRLASAPQLRNKLDPLGRGGSQRRFLALAFDPLDLTDGVRRDRAVPNHESHHPEFRMSRSRHPAFTGVQEDGNGQRRGRCSRSVCPRRCGRLTETLGGWPVAGTPAPRACVLPLDVAQAGA
jgi:hypothetical protein